VEDAAPAGEVDEGVNLAGGLAALVFGAGLLSEGGRVVGFVLLEREVDEQRFADDGLARDEAPVTAVFAVVAVVAHDEVVAGRDDEVAVVDEAAHADPPVRVDLGVGALEAGEVVAEIVGRRGAVDGVGFGEGVAVDEYLAGMETEAVAGQADDALNQMQRGVDGVVEDDDVAAMDGGRGKETGRPVFTRHSLFVDEEEVTDEECGLHRFGRDAERLGAEGDDEDRDDDEVEERLERGEDAGLVVDVMGRLLAAWFRRWVGNRGWDCFGSRRGDVGLGLDLGLDLGFDLGLDLAGFDVGDGICHSATSATAAVLTD
jgi:hypothetical protein